MKTIGFIGQGWIGKHYADDFEMRGFDTVRYALEEPYVQNKEAIADCELVFIAVPTPTTKAGFDDTYVQDALRVVGKGQLAVIKSTITVGTTKRLQSLFPDLVIFHSPEFLREKSAAHDAANPDRNLIGIPQDTARNRQLAQEVLAVLPKAPYEQIMDSDDAELVKYAGNCFLYTKVLFMNILFDLVKASGGDWDKVREAMVHDPRIGDSHTEPVHNSGHDTSGKTGVRGAGGHCFIKDFETFRLMYKDLVADGAGEALLNAKVEYNIQLLLQSNKDTDLLEGVYGDLSKWQT
jgi:nucleotide sugar dehydrogenase